MNMFEESIKTAQENVDRLNSAVAAASLENAQRLFPQLINAWSVLAEKQRVLIAYQEIVAENATDIVNRIKALDPAHIVVGDLTHTEKQAQCFLLAQSIIATSTLD